MLMRVIQSAVALSTVTNVSPQVLSYLEEMPLILPIVSTGYAAVAPGNHLQIHQAVSVS